MQRSKVFNLRKRPRISYYEPQEPNLDEYLFCTDCGDFVYEYCSIHGPLLVIPDDKVPAKHSVPAIVPRAALTIPHVFLHLARSSIPGAGIGVFTTLTLPQGVRFGPYRGQKTDEIDSMYCWQIYGNNNRASHVIDAGDPRRSNWMRYVNCSRHWCEQNLIAYQYRGQIYYRTTRIIPRFTELMVYYGSEFANKLGIDLKRYNAPLTFAEKLGSTKPKKSPVPEKSVIRPSMNEQENLKDLGNNPKRKTKSKDLQLDKSNIVKKQHREKRFKLNNKQVNENKPVIKNNKTRKLKADDTKIVNLHKKNKNNISVNTNLVKPITLNNISIPENLVEGKTSETVKTNFGFNSNNNNFESVKDSTEPKVSESVQLNDEVLNNTLPSNNINKVQPYEISNIKIGEISNMLLCEICPYGTNSELLNSHLRAHASDVRYDCDKCHYKTIKSHLLKMHLRVHSSDKPNSCAVCNKTFSLQSDLKKHFRIHSGEKPYSCTVCNKTFNQEGNLKTHMRIHSGEKPYSCMVCNKTFSHQSALKSHMRIHSGEKPYSCTVCNKTFTQQITLKNHMRIHSGEKPYSCTVCYKAFSNRSSLKHHLKIHSNV